MTAPARPAAGVAPYCRIGEHDTCPGPAEVRLPGAPRWELPVEVLRCSCDCHRRR